MKKFFSNMNATMVTTILMFIAFSLLIYLFPYSGDDWAWGSEIGLARLEKGFDNYNGRYLGNLLVMVLTRSKIINIITMGVSFVSICFLPKVFSDSKRILPYVFGVFLFLLVPQAILVQTVVWTAGFTNYIPPILMTMVYFIIIRNIFDDDIPQNHWVSYIIVAIIGFASALFMENVTLYNIAISALLILFGLIKFKKVFLINVIHLIGSVAGAVLMFSNSAYITIANSDDSYRSTAFDQNLFETIIEHTNEIFVQFFSNNCIVLIILSVLCALIYLLYAKRSSCKRAKVIGAIAVILNIFSLGIIFAKNKVSDWRLFVNNSNSNSLTIIVFALVAIVYFASVCLIVFLCVEENKMKWKTILLLISIPILIIPLVLVNPIGPRCFFPPYFMLISAMVMLLVYIQNNVKTFKMVDKFVVITLLTGCLAIFVFLFNLYSTIHFYDCKRNDYVQKQVDAGCETVVVCKLPFTSHVWVGDPMYPTWDERYKYYHGIDQNIKFEYMNYTEFDEWCKRFDEGDF